MAVGHWSPIMGSPECVAGGLPSLHTPKLTLGQDAPGHKVSAAEASLGWSRMNPDVLPTPGVTVITIQSERSFILTVFLLQHIVYLLSKFIE